MAAEPFRLADLNVANLIAEKDGKPTAYFQRFIQDMNRRIALAIVDLQAIDDEFAAQLLLIETAQLAADDAQDTADDAIDIALEFTLELGFGQYGLSTVSPDAGGYVFITHAYPGGLPFPPTLGACSLQAAGSTYCHPQLTAVDATTLTGILFDAAGSPLTSGSYQVAWRVAGA